MSDINIDKSTPAVIEWQWGDATRSLIEPDPKYANITLTTRFDTTCSFFELSIPIKIKHTRLKDDKEGDGVSALFLRICPSTVKTFSFASTTTAPNAIQKKLTSRTTRLDFRLDRHVDILVPKNSDEPLIPARGQSGIVLDAIRQVSNTTILSVYVADAILSDPQLQSISDACNHGSFKSLRSDERDLSSLYGGKGAKVVHLSAQTGQLPPPYNEIGSPPPSAPINQLKRRRQDSETECGGATTELQAMLGKMEARMLAKMEERLKGLQPEKETSTEGLNKRIEELENENQRLKESMEERIKGLENENRHLREGIDKLRALLENQSDDVDRVGEQTSENTAELVTIGDELTHVRHDVDELVVKVDSLERGDLVEIVKSDVLEYIRVRLWGND
jgi:FtsZ-binding cell division protein ZapB